MKTTRLSHNARDNSISANEQQTVQELDLNHVVVRKRKSLIRIADLLTWVVQ